MHAKTRPRREKRMSDTARTEKPILQARLSEEQEAKVAAYLYVKKGKRTQLVLDAVLGRIDAEMEADPALAASIQQALEARGA